MAEQVSVYLKIKAATDAIRARSSLVPQVGVVLGSGLGPIADHATETVTIPYSEIPYFHGTSVEGHSGELVLGKFEGVPVVFLKGRFHLYEGYPMSDVVFPTRVLCSLGIRSLLLTAAAGGVNTGFRAGDVMLVTDHLNLLGSNPLRGPNLAEMGPRFPDMTEAYSARLQGLLRVAAKECSLPLREGVYASVMGPTYETPAEVRMLRVLGADAVGMSTVPECIAANHLGVEVGALISISNLAAGMQTSKLHHQEVIDTSKTTTGKIAEMLKYALPRLNLGPKSAEPSPGP